MKLEFKSQYYAVDKDEHIETLCRHISKRYPERNLYYFNSLDEFFYKEKLNILLTEVIEHNTIDDAKALIKRALEYNINKMIVTTPNIEFNKFFNMENLFRHCDHIFELTSSEFRSMIEECTSEKEYKVEYFYLGDCVNGIQPTQGCIINFSS